MGSPSHKRLPDLARVRVDKLKTNPGFTQDRKYLSLLTALMCGKIKVSFTRLHLSQIRTGFYERLATGEVKHCSNLSLEDVAGVDRLIRSGARPILEVYWSPFPSPPGYVCPDDECVLAAYRSLGISPVPCRILKPKSKPGEFAAIWVEERGGLLSAVREIPPNVTNLSVFSEPTQLDLPNKIQWWTVRLAETMKLVEAFHKDGSSGPHYHHLLHSVVRRHSDFLDTVCRLMRLGREEHAIVILRACYEAYLNLHLDWISPELIGPRMQLLSAIGFNDDCEESARGKKALANFPMLFENTARKAALSSLGGRYHDVLYRTSSLVAHQSYGNAENEALQFNSPDASVRSDYVDFVGDHVDFISTSLVLLVEAEVGGR